MTDERDLVPPGKNPSAACSGDEGGGVPKVQFKTADAARFFLKQLTWEGRSPLAGSGFWPSDRWIGMADKVAGQMMRQPPNRWGETGAQRVAKLMRSYRKGAGARFLHVRCDCCGTILSAPESVALGRGPKCMEARAG